MFMAAVPLRCGSVKQRVADRYGRLAIRLKEDREGGKPVARNRR